MVYLLNLFLISLPKIVFETQELKSREIKVPTYKSAHALMNLLNRLRNTDTRGPFNKVWKKSNTQFSQSCTDIQVDRRTDST